MLKNIILGTLLLTTTLSYANDRNGIRAVNPIDQIEAQRKAAEKQAANNNIELIKSYQMDNGHLVLNKYDPNKIPASVASWIPWVKKNNAVKDCPIKANSVNCIFLISASVSEKDSNQMIEFKGSSYALEGWVKLPSEVNVWPTKAIVNGKDSIVIEKDGSPYVQVNKGDFQITVFYKSENFKNLQTLKMPDDLISFVNTTALELTYENNSLVFNKVQKEIPKDNKAKENTLTEIKVYRKLTDGIPVVLDTQIKITYSGLEKEIELGTVLPKDFVLLNASSDLKVSYRDSKYYTVIKPGEHMINFSSYVTNNIKNINIEGLVKDSPQEVWSIALNNSIRQLNIANVNQIDTTQALVPQEWKNLPTYLVKKDINLVTQSRGQALNNNVSLSENRNSWYGYNGDKMTFNSQIDVNNKGTQFFTVDKNLALQSFKVNNKLQMLVTKDKEQGIIAYNGQFNGLVQTESKDITNIPAKFFNADVTSQNWILNLAPRFRILGATGVERVQGSWVDAWNLYTVFTLFIITFSFYKLFGKKMALLSFISILSFQENSFLSWYFWIGLLIITALLKVLPHDKYSQLSNVIKKSGLVLLSGLTLIAIPFISQEIKFIINPSLELLVDHRSYYELIKNTIQILAYMGVIYFIIKFVRDIKNKQQNTTSNIIGIISLFIGVGILSALFNPGSEAMFGSGGKTGLSSRGNIRMLDEAIVNSAPGVSTAPQYNDLERRREAQIMSNQKSPSASWSVDKSNEATFAPVLTDQDVQQQKVTLQEEEKVQVGLGLPTWTGARYNILKDSKMDKPVSLFIMSPLWVNLMSIFQMIILVLVMLVFGIYLIYCYDKKEWVDKIPERIKSNIVIKWLLTELNK